MKKLAMFLAGAAAVTACSGNPEVLVLYYSQTGTTQTVAEEIGRQLGADVVRFEVTEAYEGTYDETIARCLVEREENKLPEVKDLDINLDDYDIVFLGSPIWFGEPARPMLALISALGEEAFAGKTVVPFATFGSGGLGNAVKAYSEAFPKATVAKGYGVRTARIDAAAEEVSRFLILEGYKEGEAEAYPDYSEALPVTPEEAGIFDKACSGYKFPLGTPLKAGSRPTPSGTDYVFTAVSTGPDGSESQATIFVTLPEGGEPYFTEVVRQ
ncbi:MAG: flavodoxin family protein [Candidatus Cryptobacteroides sp.]